MSEKSKKQKKKLIDTLTKLNIDTELIIKIMEVQSLPKEVVIELLKIQGSLKVDYARKENKN